ncbi:21836_t:CDS:2 [Gigaspora margarita]|uniref:21836_t:CDS:1 n=1 Tax=Gigaspora margarita TaxID=4874 RepID=A0ABM8W3C8_GIGMA|nr:21836_t:CDS:2 [Gigaspora margarita]
MDLVATKIDWTNKLNEYKNVFALLTKEFKKFAITQNEKVSGKDKEIAQLLKTDTNIVSYQEVLIEQECGYQNYGIQELINKTPNLASEEQSNSKRLEMKAKEITEYKYILASHNKNSNSTITNNCTTWTRPKKKRYFTSIPGFSGKKWNKLKHKVQAHKINSVKEQKKIRILTRMLWNKDQDLETTRNITHKKKEKAKQFDASVIQEKENCKILSVMSQILTRLKKLEE